LFNYYIFNLSNVLTEKFFLQNVSIDAINYIFVFIIFTAVTPVFYLSPNERFSNVTLHFSLFFFIFVDAICFLFTKNYILLLFFYELLVIPVFFILKYFGHYYRKVQASFFILIWAVMGSFFIFLGLILFFFQEDFSLSVLLFFDSSYSFWGLFFICLGFLVKVPLWPFHFWISRAHAEGPSNLSIFLSGVLVKLSIYGILRFLYLTPLKTNFTLFYYLAVIGVIDSTLKMLIQIDSKVVIAFSTTVQMNLICFILFSLTIESNQTLKLGLVNHLLTASILFFFADQILVRFNTREFFFICGLYYFLPALSGFLTLFIINQINFPGFLGFFLDVYFLTTSLPDFFGMSFFLFFFLFVIEHLYILFFFLKILYGTSLTFKNVIFKDLSYDEVALSLFLLSSSFLFGTFPLTLTVIFLFFVLFYILCYSTPLFFIPYFLCISIFLIYIIFFILFFLFFVLNYFLNFKLKPVILLLFIWYFCFFVRFWTS